MGLFDSLKNQAKGVVRDAMQNMGNKTESIVFPNVPDSFEGFVALPQAAMSTPFETAAMTVVALCVYPHAPETSVQMLNFLRGPRPLNGQEISFIRDRFRTKDYVPRSYFNGATPQNDYTPQPPYTIQVMADHNSFLTQGMAKLFMTHMQKAPAGSFRTNPGGTEGPYIIAPPGNPLFQAECQQQKRSAEHGTY